ncbi:acyl-CoA reductase [Blattabacterium cuenoti]|uniref:acyl-CoA reductase n=1 Tax=Blattabacterium cuenoti TaxID=1653831 RepID=UPI00163D239A|nr:acyl-CoA reductase [Blattabacterium cuenoti]
MIKIIKSFVTLGKLLSEFKNIYKKKYRYTYFNKFFVEFESLLTKKQWFLKEDLIISFDYWSKVLKKDKIESWIEKYPINRNQKNVLVIMPGNIPMAGFHDLLCVILSGNNIIIKLSEKDNIIIPIICRILINENSSIKNKIKFTKNFLNEKYDCVIATGNNNSFRYFNFFFLKKNIPSLIRKNRISISVLQGNENKNDLLNLSKDILYYYGRGCRNVGKIFIPYNYNIDLILKSSYICRYVKKNRKYMNNYKYYKSIFIMNKINFFKNEFLILKKEKKYNSPISILYYEFYKNLENLKKNIYNYHKNIQCIISKNFIKEEIHFGTSQYPKLEEYPDKIDTIKFLNKLIK